MESSIEQSQRNVTTVDYRDIDGDIWVMLTADRHHDNKLCRRDLEKRHLELARERNAYIIDCGDLFCAMQGKYDPRSDLNQVRQEDATPYYLDNIVKHAAEDYAPYAANFLVLGIGNHESKITERHGVNLTSNLAHQLNQVGGRVQVGGYGGWVRLHFWVTKTRLQAVRVKYFHGAGGGGPVTRGVIQSNRQSVYLPDAEVVVNGHTHDAWHVPIARERLNLRGVVTRDIVHHVRTPGYKDEYRDGAEGWAVERWSPPKPLGAVWLRFRLELGRITMGVMVDVE